jgi:drug/metabolite transporter (DMT)-like permease
LFRAGARRSLGRPAHHVFLEPASLAGYALLFGVTLLNLKVYRVLPFKAAVLVLPFNTLFVGLFSALFLGERLQRNYWLGAVLILAGIALFNS